MSAEDEGTLEFDESKLSGEDGEIQLFHWLCMAEKRVLSMHTDELKKEQVGLQPALLKVISASSPYPSPGRPVRNVVSRCFRAIYTRGETRTLFDTLQALLKLVSDMKSQEKDTVRIAAFYCVGELMATFGAQVMSFMMEIAVIALKWLRSSTTVLLRYHALTALRKSFVTAGRAVVDNTLKDILKQAKAALHDKSLPVQRAAAEILVVLHPGDDNNRAISDVEYVVTTCTKGLEGADQETRRALARLVGHMLAQTQTIRAPPPVDHTKKAKKDKEQDDDDIGTPQINAAAAANSAKTVMTPVEMLTQLSAQFNKPNVSRKTRIGIFEFYYTMFTILGGAFIESNYSIILKHFVTDIIMTPRSQSTRYELLLVRQLVGIILRDLIGHRLLSEQGQIAAIQELSNSYLKKWPALLPGQSAPPAPVLVVALKEVAGLLQQLGNAPPPVQDALSEPLVTLLAHPNHSTRVAAAWALRCFAFSTPIRIPKLVLGVMELLQRDITFLATPTAPSDINERALGHAYGLGALFSVIPERPLYVSSDISAKVFDIATNLLKRAGEHDVHFADVEVEVAWQCIASLMALGPNFVRVHLPQLLVLWRNALPKPTSKDTSLDHSRAVADWEFLLHVRECALGSILCFLKHNSPTLVTLDVARRIGSLLSNTLLFANTFVQINPGQKIDPAAQGAQGGPAKALASREALLRRRIYQCYAALGYNSLSESLQSSLLQSAITLFGSSEGYAGSALQAAIATSSGNFTSLWHCADGYAYGATTLNIEEDVTSDPLANASGEKSDRFNRDAIEVSIDELLTRPVLGSCEHDPILLCLTRPTTTDTNWPQPPPSATSVVDSSIDLFGTLLPLQDASSCSKIINELIETVRSSKLDKNMGRKAAVVFNATVAVASALRNSGNLRHCGETLGSPQVSATLADFLKDGFVDGDSALRVAASEAIGRLASIAGTNFLTGQIKRLVDQVVNNRDPQSRAGCALAFGSIYSHVGGLAAGPLLKTTVNVLMSLSNDPHPVVNFWSLSALCQVVEAASLGYAPFVSSTLGMLFKIYMSDAHEPEGGTLTSANLKGNLPAYQVVCKLIDAVVTVVGPDMQESSRTRTVILDMVHEFSMELDEGIGVEAIKCVQHFLMFAPEHIQIGDVVNKLRAHLSSSRTPLKLAAINALYQLVQRDALTMSKLGGDQLVEELFGMLDKDASIGGVRNVISSWLQQTVVHNPSAWIDLCQRIMSRTTASQRASDNNPKLNTGADDEGESLSVGMSQDQQASASGLSTSRWRTQLFALQCLHSICKTVHQSGRREHLDIPFAKSQALHTQLLLVSRVPDLIKMAFTASAAYVTEIRLEGLVVLRDVIEVFSKSPDPDYEDLLLLEQYQAPITAALTPAFSADSTPEILSSAIQVCAVFVGSGVVKDVTRMGRILKLLTSALDQSKQSGTLSLGDAGELSPNASVMLRISTLSAWAELQVASASQSYLVDVVQPYVATLAPLWLAALRDYASIRGDTEVLQDSGPATMDGTYTSLGREVLLPYYVESWPVILHAVAISMKKGDAHISSAMDGQESATTNASHTQDQLKDKTEPTAMFFPMFGLIYEALATSSSDATSQMQHRANAVVALTALGSLVRPQYSGKVLLEPVIFEELTSLFYRMTMTEPATVQIHLVETVAALAAAQLDRLLTQSLSNGQTNGRITSDMPLTHLLRICAFVIRQAISSRGGGPNQDQPKDRVQLIRSAFSALVSVSNAFGPAMKEETRAVAIALYADLLKDEKADIDLAGPTLSCLKSILEQPPKSSQPELMTRYSRLVHGLLSSTLLNIDEMRGRQGFISTMKVTNNLLAAVLILTVVPPEAKFSKVAIDYCCYLISQKLSDEKEISLRAAHCAKTLILAGSVGNVVLQHCVKSLFPGVIEYLAMVAALGDDAGAQEAHLTGVDEILKALTSFFNSTSEAHRARVLAVLLPAIVLLLDPSKSPTSPIHNIAIAQLLALASASPAAFKEATNRMEESARDTLEVSVRQSLDPMKSKAAGHGNAAKPQISLKAF